MKESSQIIEVAVSQDLQHDGEKHGINKDKTTISEQSQDNTDNNQSESDKDTIVQTSRTSSRIKKIPCTRGEDFLWLIYHGYVIIH
jgi:hypothetical protein